MTDRRSFITGLAMASAAVATPVALGTPLMASTTAQDPRWLALLADMTRADAAHSKAFDAHDAAEDRYYAMKPEMWKAVLRPTSTDENGVIFFDPDVYNAEVAAARKKYEEDEAEARIVSGYDETAALQTAALDRLTASIREIIAYPSRDPDIIAAKLGLIIKEYGDDNGDLGPLLKSLSPH